MWSYVDKNEYLWKTYGYYSDGSYWSGVNRIGRWKVKSCNLKDEKEVHKQLLAIEDTLLARKLKIAQARLTLAKQNHENHNSNIH